MRKITFTFLQTLAKLQTPVKLIRTLSRLKQSYKHKSSRLTHVTGYEFKGVEMKAFTDTLVTKEEFLTELKKHQAADAFLRGTYADESSGDFKGCAVGCSIQSVNVLKGTNFRHGDHSKYPDIIGVPQWLARLEDRIFEGVSLERSKKWPIEFTEAINIGADLSKVLKPFLIIILESTLEYVQKTSSEKQKEAIKYVVEKLKDDKATKEDFLKARRIAYTAAVDAAAAAAAAAYAAAYAAAAAAVYAAAAAYAADVAADAAAYDAADAYDAYDAADAAATYRASPNARIKKFEYFADKLLELMRDCK